MIEMWCVVLEVGTESLNATWLSYTTLAKAKLNTNLNGGQAYELSIV